MLAPWHSSPHPTKSERLNPLPARSRWQHLRRVGKLRRDVELAQATKLPDRNHENEFATSPRTDRKERLHAQLESGVAVWLDGKRKPSSNANLR